VLRWSVVIVPSIHHNAAQDTNLRLPQGSHW
jgi:hypothetical protein